MDPDDDLEPLPEAETAELTRRVEAEYRELLEASPDASARTPSEVVLQRPQLTLRHYGPQQPAAGMLPVLMVPPLAASATCYDLRPGYSLAAHFVQTGRPTYLADYGDISLRRDQDLGLEHWVEDVLPTSVEEVSQRHDGAAVHLIAWSLGGILAVATQAERPDVPIRSIAMVGTPFDFDVSPALKPVRMARRVTGGRVGGSLIRIVGGTPRPVNMAAFYLTDPVRLATKPLFKYRHREDEEVIAHVEAIDALMDRMGTYSGRTLAQLYHRFVAMNEIAGGTVTLGETVIDLAAVSVPVLAIAGEGDQVLGPKKSIFHAREVLPNAEVTLTTVPGGHVGALTGRSAPGTTWVTVDEYFAAHEGV